jgi:hypothetical protein
VRRRVERLLDVRGGGDEERSRRGHPVRGEHAEFARAGLGVRIGRHRHEQTLTERRRRLQRVAADVERPLDDRDLLLVKFAENLPPPVGAPFLHAGLRARRERRRGAVAHRDAVEPFCKITELGTWKRRKSRHGLDGQHLHALA